MSSFTISRWASIFSRQSSDSYYFKNYKQHFFENFVKIKDLKQFDDGSLVCLSETKRIRFPCSISAISIAIPKLNREFYQAKKKMMENGFMHNTIDLQLPDYRQVAQQMLSQNKFFT